ncbi:hypothetical protein MHB54_28005 [Paenibacillus sp. FSL M7-0802]|uniref:hypothetical protein n=1 Tax=Paenibacillus sp. FSL M7-0802 TaxID=2921536 RepID=UPI0030F8A639
MKNIEAVLIGEQAKKFREAAGITLEELQKYNQEITVDFKAFEDGKIYSPETINELQQLYNRTIENLYIEKGQSFIGFLEKYSLENGLDSESLIDTYYYSIADSIVNNEDKKRTVNIVKQLMINTNRSIENYYSSQDNAKQLKLMFNELMDVTKDSIQSNKIANEECHSHMAMADILIRIVSASDHKDEIINSVEEDMKLYGEEDFPEYDEESYVKLINELKTYWDVNLYK